MIRIYTKEVISKEVHTINLTIEEANQVLEGNIFKDCPDYNEDNAIMVESDSKLQNPTWDGEVVREMTREEQILILNKTELLSDGEILQDGEIVKVECPEGLIRPRWNRELKEWYESMTQEELLEKRTQKILEYSKLETEKKVLESSKFTIPGEIELITEKMEKVEQEINELASQITLLAKAVTLDEQSK